MHSGFQRESRVSDLGTPIQESRVDHKKVDHEWARVSS